MPEKRIIYRRVYYSECCKAPENGDFDFGFRTIDSIDAEVFIGSHPKFPLIAENAGSQSRSADLSETPLFKVTNLGGSNSDSDSCGVYLEIFCSDTIQSPDHRLSEDAGEISTLPDPDWDQAEAMLPRFERVADVIAGMIGLKFSPLLVYRRYGDVLISSCGDREFYRVYCGPGRLASYPVPKLDNEQLDELRGWLAGIGALKPDTLPDMATGLRWIMRAWRERTVVGLFMSLSTTLEFLCNQVNVHPDPTRESKARLIRSLIEAADESTEKSDLLLFFDNIERRTRGASWRERFAALVDQVDSPEKNRDLEAFDKFKRMRNALVHHGGEAVEIEIALEDRSVTSSSRMVERYLASGIFGRECAIYTSEFQTSGFRAHIDLSDSAAE